MFTVNRNYTAPVLDDDVIERFIADKTPIEDPAQRRVFQHFNGGTGITSFLLHFDNRCGVADSGPYPIPGGGWLVVRDHVLNDQEYPWSEEVSTLPYAITQVMFFEGGEEIQKSFVDIGTMFTTPANYLRALSGYAVYVKQTEQTPMAKIRLMTQDEMSAMSTEAERASSTLYRRVAAMSEREKILAGTRVYYTDFIAPVAKAAGVWQEMLDNGFQHIDDVVDEVYDVVTSPGKADDLLARHWGAGAGFQHI